MSWYNTKPYTAKGNNGPGGGPGWYFTPQSHSNGGTANPAIAKSASELIKQTLANWGLSSLAGTAINLWKNGGGGTSPDVLRLELENTQQWKQRFSGNELRVKQGLAPLDPAQYIAMEDGYRQVARQYGLSDHYYSQEALAKLIGNGVSATEYQTRAQIALQTFTQAPDEYKKFWQQYGLTPGDAVSAIMDTSGHSLADIQLKANAVQIGGTALQQGIQISGGRAKSLAENGVTITQARQAYQQIADYGANVAEMAHRYGQTFNQTDMENALLLNNPDAIRKQNLIFGSEAANFTGHGGNNVNSANSGANY